MFCASCGNEVSTVSYAPCPRCGRPTNGAQVAPPATTSGGNTIAVIIAVVVGGFVLVGIVGIIAAIAIPNFIAAKSRAQQKRTMADMRTIGASLEAYKSDNNDSYPNASSIEALAPLLSPKYIGTLPKTDGWAHPLMYFCYKQEEGRCAGYVLGSGGRDGMFEHSEPRAYVDSPAGATSHYDCDLIFADGQFIEYPEGTQH